MRYGMQNMDASVDVLLESGRHPSRGWPGSGGASGDELQSAEVVAAHVQYTVAEPECGDRAQVDASAVALDDQVGLLGHDGPLDGEGRPVGSSADAQPG